MYLFVQMFELWYFCSCYLIFTDRQAMSVVMNQVICNVFVFLFKKIARTEFNDVMPRETLKLFGAILRCVVLECLCLFSNVDLAALQLILTCTPHRRTWLWLGIKKT